MPKPNVRDHLLQSGMRTLYKRGFNGCGVQDITSAAGVPKGSFYNHFESKEAFALAALELFWVTGQHRRELLTDEARDPVERLQRHFQALSKAIVQHDLGAGCLIGNFSAELPPQSEGIRSRLAGIYKAWTSPITACVREIADANRLRVTLPADQVASYLVHAWEGAVLRAKVDGSDEAFAQFDRVTFAVFFD